MPRVVCILDQIMVTGDEKNPSRRLSKVYFKTIVDTQFSDTFFLQAQFKYHIFIFILLSMAQSLKSMQLIGEIEEVWFGRYE